MSGVVRDGLSNSTDVRHLHGTVWLRGCAQSQHHQRPHVEKKGELG